MNGPDDSAGKSRTRLGRASNIGCGMRPAQASLTLRLVGLLSRLWRPCHEASVPGRAARQLPDQSTTLWVESSSTGDPRLRGALPEADVVDLREPRFFACSAAARR